MRVRVNLPQTNFRKTVLKFKETVTCKLAILLNGIDEKNIPKEHESQIRVTKCEHPAWPPVSKVCESCVLMNTPERFVEDKKGRQMRVIG